MALDGPRSPPLAEVQRVLTESFGPAIGEPAIVDSRPRHLSIDLPKERLLEVVRALRDDFGFHHCTLISAVDWSTHFAVVYHLTSWTSMEMVEINVTLPREDPTVDSISPLYGGANWHEREAFDLMGITFTGHPDLRRILLPDWWEGHPLRKDYNYDMELDKVGPMGHAEEGQDIHGTLPSGVPVEGPELKKMKKKK